MNSLSDESAIAMAKAMFSECEADFFGGWCECRSRAEEIIEERERKAWEACWSYLFDPGDKDLEEGYRAYQEKQKE